MTVVLLLCVNRELPSPSPHVNETHRKATERGEKRDKEGEQATTPPPVSLSCLRCRHHHDDDDYNAAAVADCVHQGMLDLPVTEREQLLHGTSRRLASPTHPEKKSEPVRREEGREGTSLFCPIKLSCYMEYLGRTSLRSSSATMGGTQYRGPGSCSAS